MLFLVKIQEKFEKSQENFNKKQEKSGKISQLDLWQPCMFLNSHTLQNKLIVSLLFKV